MLHLEPHGPDTYVGTGPQYPWGGLYGGQIVAQALQAATQTVEPKFWVNSIHAYFIRRGDATEPIRFEVNRVRDGRSFVTRQVIARQATGAILSLQASFQVDEEAPEVQTAVMRRCRSLRTPATTRGRRCSSAAAVYVADPPGIGRGWLRTRKSLGDDRALNACALAYLSDDFPTDAAVAQLRTARRRMPSPATSRWCRSASTTPSGSIGRSTPIAGTSTTSRATA